MIGKLDQKFVPSLVSYLPSDLLNPDNDAEPVAATSSPTPRSKHQVQNGGAAGTAAAAVDTAAAAAGTAAPASQAAAAAAGPQAAEAAAAAQTASAPANADAPSEAGHSNAERPSFHAGRYGSSQRKTGQQHKSGQDAVGSRKRRRSGAPLRSSQHSHVQCKQGATASHAEQQSATASHAGQQSATASQAEQQSATASRAGQQSATASHADLQGATASHAEHQDATANHRDQQGAISNPADRHGATASQSEQQEATASHAEVPQSEGNPESSWTGHRHSRPYDSGTAPDLDTSNGGSNQSDTDWQPWKDGYEDGSTRSEPPGRPGLQSSMHDLLIRLQIFIMACWRSGRSCCKTEAARICSFLASDTKVAAVYLKHGTLLCLAVMTGMTMDL